MNINNDKKKRTEEEAKKLFDENINLIYYVINNNFYTITSIDPSIKDDLYQAGMIGLWVASYYYDENNDEGYKFSTYAVKSIWGQMIRELNNGYRNSNKSMFFRNMLSLDSLIYDDDKETLLDYQDNGERVEENLEMKDLTNQLIDILRKNPNVHGEREIDIFKKRFIYRYTLEEIGNYYGVTRERIRQITSKHIKILKKHKKEILGL